MGRIFEVRKATMFARWDRMAKQFTRIGKEIAIAVKSGGPDPSTTPALRRGFQHANSVHTPKVPVLVETATDNHVRTVANVKSHCTKGHGALGNSGSVSFQFKKMGVFKLKPEGLNTEDLELELIDFGLEELGESSDDEGNTVL